MSPHTCQEPRQGGGREVLTMAMALAGQHSADLGCKALLPQQYFADKGVPPPFAFAWPWGVFLSQWVQMTWPPASFHDGAVCTGLSGTG